MRDYSSTCGHLFIIVENEDLLISHPKYFQATHPENLLMSEVF